MQTINTTRLEAQISAITRKIVKGKARNRYAAIAKASGNRKSILSWIRSRQTIEFLDVWERKHNTNYDGAQLSTVYKLIRERNFSIRKVYALQDSLNSIKSFINLAR